MQKSSLKNSQCVLETITLTKNTKENNATTTTFGEEQISTKTHDDYNKKYKTSKNTCKHGHKASQNSAK